VRRWLDEDRFPQAEVEPWWDDTDSETSPEPDLAALVARVRRLAALASELGDGGLDAARDLPDDGVAERSALSYALVALAPLGPADRQKLLECDGPGGRLELLTRLLDEVEPGLLFRLGNGPSPLDPPPAW